MESFGYTTAEERKEQVKKLHARGCHQTVISDILEASRSTIRRDCHELGLGTWSPLPDADLRKHILDIIEIEHTAAGQRKVESHLVSQEATNGKITDIMPEKLKGPLNQPTNYLTDKNVSVESNFGDSRPLSISPFPPQPSSIPSRPTTGGQFDVRTSESHAAPRPLRSIRKLWLQC